MTENIKRLNPHTLPGSTEIGYSQITVVEPGRMAYVSGQVAVSPDGTPVPDNIVEQTKVVVKNLRSALDAVNASPNDIAIMRVFVVDLCPEILDQTFPLLLEMLDGAQPCITGIGVAALAAPELKIEVEMTIRVPE